MADMKEVDLAKHRTPGWAWKDTDGKSWVFAGTEDGLHQFLSLPENGVVTVMRLTETEVIQSKMMPEQNISVDGQQVKNLWNALVRVPATDHFGTPVVDLDEEA